ncbi:Uncharacterized protein ACMD2_04708, partial [Ananas comosus]
MTQSGGGGGGGGGGAEFHLPDEILAVMPTDPYEQLDLARKITSMAIASRVSKLEIEASRMRQRVAEKDLLIAELQEKLSQRDQMFREADARLRTALEENLETFKRHLMLSLNDDGSSQQETVDIRTCDQSVAKVSAWKGLLCSQSYLLMLFRGLLSITNCLHAYLFATEDGGSISHPASNLSTDAGNMTQEGDLCGAATRLTGQKFSITPHITPRLTPTATPKITSTCGSPRGYGGSPKLTSGASSPTKPRFDGHVAMSPWFPSSKQTSAANSPPRGRLMPGRTPRIDGKEFFRQARSRLSYEQFAAFLANIKELNAHRQSRE